MSKEHTEEMEVIILSKVYVTIFIDDSQEKDHIMNNETIKKLTKIGLSPKKAQDWIKYLEQTIQAGQEPAYTENDLFEMWEESYKFNIDSLNFNSDVARERANCEVRSVVYTDLEFNESD